MSDLSHLCLLLTLGMTFFSFFSSSPQIARQISLLQFGLVSFAFLSCIVSFLKTDLSVLNVVEHSHSDLPVLYKIAASWGNHEGSILLWTWILSLYSALFSLTSSSSLLSQNALRIQSLLLSFFTFFLLFTSNPLLKITLPFENGAELNPVLQDPVLAIHPPFIYLGYLGSVIPFSVAVSALLSQSPTPSRVLQPWILLSWIFLTLGILLGSWWAYYELGWGGWWFWDPVENSSLMPWLLNTALLHACRSSLLSSFTILLSLFHFFLSVFGTFLVRSGFLESVHSFAQDQGRAWVLLSFCLVTLLFLCLLVYRRRSFLLSSSQALPLQKDYALFLLFFFMMVMTFFLIFGTFYPFLHQTLFHQSVTLGAPFYQSFLTALLPPFFLAMTASSYLSWRTSWKGTTFLFDLMVSVVFSLPVFFLWFSWDDMVEQPSFFFFLFLLVFGLLSLFFSFPHLPFPSFLAHLGVWVFSWGALFSSFFSLEATYLLKMGDEFYFHGLSYVFHSLNQFQGPNYHSSYATLFALQDGEPLFALFPEKRYYFLHGTYSTKPYVLSHFLGDLYVLLGDGNHSDGWEVKFYWNPFLSFLWIGGLLLLLSGIFSFFAKIPSIQKASRYVRNLFFSS